MLGIPSSQFGDFENNEYLNSLIEGPKFTDLEAGMICEKCNRIMAKMDPEPVFDKSWAMNAETYAKTIIEKSDQIFNSSTSSKSIYSLGIEEAYVEFYNLHVKAPAEVLKKCNEELECLETDYLSKRKEERVISTERLKEIGLVKFQAYFILEEIGAATPSFDRKCKTAYENFMNLPASPRSSFSDSKSPDAVSSLFRKIWNPS